MTEHVLVVGSGREFPTRLRRALPGVQTSVICRLEYVSKLRELTEHTRVIAVRHDAPDEEWVALAAAVHARHPFTRSIAFGERDQDRYAIVSEALGIEAHSPETVRLVQDKEAMRVRLREAGVDDTVSARVASAAELRAFAAGHGLPLVVKPISGAGSAGVTVVREEGGLGPAFERAAGDFAGIPDAGVLVERFHEGPQFSVEAFSELGEHEIVAITQKHSDPENFVELGHVSPAPLDAGQETAVREYVARLLDAVGVRAGATHTEVVLGPDGPRVIETHVRMGGDEVPALAQDVTGVDLAECLIRQTLGEKVLPGVREALRERPTDRASAIWFGAAPAAGELVELTGLEEARGMPGVTAVEPLVQPGSALAPLESSDDRVAYARAQAATAEEALDAARQAVARLGFHLRVGALVDTTV
ncbi:ATP-grasp domain-containing protein [Streptomyces qinglanensis]|uniref:ATP-grasp domain-containing protein n=1 Tax=Streptomyces qinglanensis TaxID=943816 RepID=UPI003D74236C